MSEQLRAALNAATTTDRTIFVGLIKQIAKPEFDEHLAPVAQAILAELKRRLAQPDYGNDDITPKFVDDILDCPSVALRAFAETWSDPTTDDPLFQAFAQEITLALAIDAS